VLSRALGRGLWAVYDSMGALLIHSFFWTVCSIPILTMPAATAALFHVTVRLSDGREAVPADFFRAFRRYFWRAEALGALNLAAAGLILANLAFYSHLSGSLKILGVLLAGLCIWLLLLLGMVQVFAWPLLVWRKVGMGTLLKRAALITLDNPGTAFGVGLAIALFGGFAVVTVAGFIFFGAGACAMLAAAAFTTVAARYDDEVRQRREDEPDRSFREIIRPWEQ